MSSVLATCSRYWYIETPTAVSASGMPSITMEIMRSFSVELMTMIGLFAAIGPARRGLAVQPAEALRND